MIDYKIWNNWYLKSIKNYFSESAWISSDTGGGKVFPMEKMPDFLNDDREAISIRELRYLCLKQKPPQFYVQDNLSQMFLNTKNKIKMRELPFDCFFINVNIDNKFKGLLIHKTSQINKDDDINIHFRIENAKGEGLFSSVYFSQYKNDKKDFTMIRYGENGLSKLEKEYHKDMAQNIDYDRIINWVCNFLDAINHPDVEMVKIKTNFNNDESRIKRGKAPQPSMLVNLKVSGKLYRYITDESKNINNPLNQAFWVRGHYIHFRDEKKWNKIYLLSNQQLKKSGYQKDSKGIIAKWKFPFIKCKGRGKPIKKNYQLIQKKQTIPSITPKEDEDLHITKEESSTK